MDQAMKAVGISGLRFFGKMSAANAHEIKNALAVINENAGLLGDLVAMTAKGIPLDPQRLDRLADKIKQQVARADEIAKSTNQFAHSVDKSHGPADLKQAIMLINTMAMRFATQRHIKITLVDYQKTIILPTPPFMLLHLLWLCLQYAMQATMVDETLHIAMDKTDGKALVRYGPLSKLNVPELAALSDCAEIGPLLEPLNARIGTNAQGNKIVLTLKK